ncbi:hypothetical protein EG347_14450 [Chryseobacterium sp. G0186]|uniref:hypothetical protein n=1 Tax=Chryseobacterium sp. G0186 TaxID=2487064 RepID=UPI000F4EFD71|nr:hypothetical protein [Chryseobacterium sp. G0186]AZA78624.1 hypothetical protein EG347_14450 [Chryseobacterium sp. G0186]
MRKIRQISKNPVLIFLLLINFSMYSCSTESNNNENLSINKTNELKKFNDEDVFKGIIFLEGDVAELFSDYKELNFRNFVKNENEINEIVKFQNLLISSLKEQNPNFLSNFKREVTSGDYYRVHQSISAAHKEIKKQLFKFYDLTESQFSDLQNAFIKSSSEVSKPNKITKEYLLKLINSIKKNSSTDDFNTSNAEGKVNVVYTDMALVLYGVVAVVVMAIAIGFIEAPMPEKSSGNSFYYESFYADVTVKLKNM